MSDEMPAKPGKTHAPELTWISPDLQGWSTSDLIGWSAQDLEPWSLSDLNGWID